LALDGADLVYRKSHTFLPRTRSEHVPGLCA
jgi:hypothetical protein